MTFTHFSNCISLSPDTNTSAVIPVREGGNCSHLSIHP